MDLKILFCDCVCGRVFVWKWNSFLDCVNICEWMEGCNENKLYIVTCNCIIIIYSETFLKLRYFLYINLFILLLYVVNVERLLIYNVRTLSPECCRIYPENISVKK